MKFVKRFLCGLFLVFGAFAPNVAFAGWGLIDIDSLDISKLVPIVLDSFMFVANGTYSYFVGEHHDGFIYLLVWGFLLFYIALYLIKLYIPKFWTTTFGFKSGDTIDKVGGMKIAENVIKPSIRALVAVIVLLPLRPQFITENLINPVLKFGSIYTTEIIKVSTSMDIGGGREIDCPRDLLDQGWLSRESCNYLIQPVHVLSQANNTVIKRGFRYLSNGLSSLTTLMLHNGGQGFMNIITGILLITTFVGCNIFMALLIIQAIFNFGMAVILYPFNVAAWVAKKSDAWFDLWPVFSNIVDALKQMVITMIACAFISCVNLALVRALFQWNSSMFVAAAGGVAHSNLPNMGANASGFGGHSMVWLSCILTFLLMNKIFAVTREKLTGYVGKDATSLFESTRANAKDAWGGAKSSFKEIKGAFKFVRGGK